MRNNCTLNKMNKLQRHISISMNLKNIKSKKSKTKEYISYDFIYIKFKNLEIKLEVFEVRIVVPFVEGEEKELRV